MTHIKMLFIFSLGIGKYFIGNALRTSDYSVIQLIYILHFFLMDNVFHKPPES